MTYRRAFILFIAVFVVFFAPVLFRAEVIFPHNNEAEVGLPITPDPGHLSSLTFADESRQFVPEINLHLRSRHRAWLATWNPDTELGRPAFQFGGFGKAYILSEVIAFFTDDPFVFYSCNILFTVFLSGLFMFLLVRSLDLSPLACFVAACFISFGVYFAYWLTFFVFLSSFCWTLGLIWVSRRFIQRPSAPLGLGAAFFSYSLFMTAYPQFIILQSYLMAGFVMVHLYRSEGGLKKKVLTACMLGGAIFFGAFLTVPIYIDIFETAARSARLHAGPDFLMRNMPKIHSFGELVIFLHTLFDPFIFGNPISLERILRFDGFSLSPLYSSLFLLTFTRRQWKRLWPWQVFVLLCVIGTALPAAHFFAIRYLGLKFSATNYLEGALVPVAVLVAYSTDYLLYSDRGGAPLRKAVVFLSLLPVGLLLLLYGRKLALSPSFFYVALDIALVVIFYALTIIPSRTLRTVGIIGLTLITVFVYGRSLALMRPESMIKTSSPLVDFMREQTGGGATRIAFVGYKNLVPPNEESLLGLKSIHAYDSLSSREYQAFIKKLSLFGAYTYGRHFDFITDGRWLRRPEFSYAGIGLYISTMDLQGSPLLGIGQWGGYRFYKPAAPPIMAAQVLDFEEKEGGVILAGRLEDHRLLPVRRLDRFTDYKTFSLNPLEVPSLLFISGQFHPRWRARTRGASLRTVKVNNFFEGVIIPPGTEKVSMEFRPWTLYIWVPEVIFVLLGVGLFGWYLLSHMRKGFRPYHERPGL